MNSQTFGGEILHAYDSPERDNEMQDMSIK